MTLPSVDTTVLYPDGTTTTEATVLHVEPVTGGLAVLLDRTSCHPVDAGWPDQGADRAVICGDDGAIEVLDCLVGATDGVALFVGADVPVRKGTDGWAFVAAHIVPRDTDITEGDTVTVVADEEYRRELSLGHTACHLASLALNLALAGAWSKETTTDALGSPDFDKLAIESSTIGAFGSTDVYRIGKSLRRKGFDASAVDRLDEIEAAVNATLGEWVVAAASVSIEREGERLTDRRYWVAELPEGTTRIPCGGTHATSTSELGSVAVTLQRSEVEGAVQVVMRTTATPLD